MSSTKPLEGLPVNGVFPLTLSPAFMSAMGKGKGPKEDVIGLKCTRLFPSFLLNPFHPHLFSSVLFVLWTAMDSEDICKKRADDRHIQTRINHAQNRRSIRYG